MNELFQIGDKIKILKKGENSGFAEVGRGIVLALAIGKTDWIKFLDKDVTDIACGEWLPVLSPCLKVIKW